MIRLSILVLSGLLAVPSPAVRGIERAFFLNSADLLAAFLPPGRSVVISLPEPIGFSDQVSGEQACLLFDRIFGLYETFEFYREDPVFASARPRLGILEASWSFRHDRTGRPDRFALYIALVPLEEESHARGGFAPRAWRIAEIRAERL